MIPKTPQYDNCNPEFKIKNGLYIKIANNDIDIDVYISFFVYIILDSNNKIPIMPALVTDGAKFVINI